ncbi:membrane protein [Sphingobacterium faecium NBRC 15299]|uniref:DedA family protein n=1 Tax=Sphingobacterium faecium TaxID=34087 RepID=UPI000D362ECD|nr:DedA family protein [Sphingobacterium faecium]PTX11135.1 membrane-associated protein [Sphingobacterium faecium]GEM63002.1 membrane protein [Sphingobacterium faecium NBRC 15299]
MEILTNIVDFIFHIDRHLVQIVHEYEGWTYLVLFLIVFAETGLVVAPFLPGDSVLFALGAIIAIPESGLSLLLFWLFLIFAAILGDFVNYEIGKYLGLRVFKTGSKIFKPEYLERTQSFYLNHGSKTIIYARFVPIVRTFAPFVAGISKMPYPQFGTYNMLGGFLWVTLFLFAGYFFGQLPFFKNHFSIVVLVIIFISLFPMLIQVWKTKKSIKV